MMVDIVLFGWNCSQLMTCEANDSPEVAAGKADNQGQECDNNETRSIG
jgi:hypothetical protein